LFAIIQAAGWPIWFLLIASVISVTVIIERLLYLRAARILPPNLLPEVIAVTRSGSVDAEVVERLESNSPLGRVLAAGMRNREASREVMKEAIEEAGRAAAHQLERYLTTLGTIATLAPLMGLFGTVIGMIELFGATGGVGADPLQVAHGISVALYNTGFGLAVAMPSLVFHRHIHALVDGFVIDMEQQAVRFVDTVTGQRD
jgi:biopolymer transport protein ExbB